MKKLNTKVILTNGSSVDVRHHLRAYTKVKVVPVEIRRSDILLSFNTNDVLNRGFLASRFYLKLKRFK